MSGDQVKGPRNWGGGERVRLAAVLACAAAPFVASPADAATGDIAQKAAPAGCVSGTGSGGECQSGVALDTAEGVAVSPDGTSVYVTGPNSGGIAIFDRSTTTGELTQKSGTAGCITSSGGTCQSGVATAFASGIAVSPDGTSVYVAAEASDAVAIFDRASNGTLTQKAMTAGCVSEDGSGGSCQNGNGLDGANDVVVSPNGASVYTTASGSNAVAIFDRAPNGALTQKASTDGCISEAAAGGCGLGRALQVPTALAISPNGAGVYVTTFTSESVAIFDRNTTTGTLSQKVGTAGCVSASGTGGECQVGVAVGAPNDVAISPDGASAYVAARFGDAIAVFDRNTTNGTLTQKAGIEGCVSEVGGGVCQQGSALNGVQGVAVSPDGASVYATSGVSDAVAIVDRDATNGELTPKAGTEACVSETGTAGTCQDGVALDTAQNVAVSPDGRNVYATASNPDAVAIFDREPISLSIDDVSVTEGDSGQVAAGFTASLTAASDQQITVDFATADGTALAPLDYTAFSGTATFPADDAAESVNVQVNGDTAEEPDETFTVGLSDPVNAAIADAAGAGTITNDDDATPPDTTITKRPRNRTAKRRARFAFRSTEAGSGFECKLDRKPFRPCESPFRKRLKPGRHRFKVRAIDAAGNRDPSPAVDRWRIIEN